MQQFVVPQFIDVEDKVFGPITVRQFFIMLIGGVAIFLSYRFADLALFALLTAFFGGLTLLFAFVKINGQTFHYFLLNLFQTSRKPSLRIWNKDLSDEEIKLYMKEIDLPDIEKKERKITKKKHMRELSLIVNTGGYYAGDDEVPNAFFDRDL